MGALTRDDAGGRVVRRHQALAQVLTAGARSRAIDEAPQRPAARRGRGEDVQVVQCGRVNQHGGRSSTERRLIRGPRAFRLGHAMNCEITYADGMAQQTNFPMHQGMRLNQCPTIVVRGLENSAQVRGVGEPPVPPAAPALAAAIFAATGKRLREMPFSKFVEFV